MKMTRTNYNKIIETLKNRANVLQKNITAAEEAAENARRCDNDDLQNICFERANVLRQDLVKVQKVIDQYDRY